MLNEFFHKGDVVLLGLCVAASLYGIVLIHSATRWSAAGRSVFEDYRSVIVQCLALAIGVCIYIGMTFVDFKLLTEKLWKLMAVFDVGFLLLLKTPLGTDNNSGNLNWIHIPGFPLDLQPNEIIKIPFILLLALQMARIKEKEQDISSAVSIAKIAGHTLFMAALIAVICGDMGMCMVYLTIFVAMAWIAGVKVRWFVLGGAGMAAAFLTAWYTVLKHDRFRYIRMRFLVVLDHSLDPQGAGFQQNRSLLALGAGQLTGQGYLQGTQTQAPYSSALPARSTDFIFSSCGEELGMIGCALMLVLLALIILRCIHVGRNSNSPFSAYVAIAFGGMLLIQTVFNVGMCLYILPVMGLTLPFFSYGGSSLITLFAAMGIVSSIKARPMPSWLRDRSHI